MWRARGIEKEIQALRDARQRTFDQLLRITQNYQSDGAQNTKDPHKYDKLSELNDLIDRKETELMQARYEITEVILQIPSGNQRSVLLKYFVGGKTLEEIAVENGCMFDSWTEFFNKAGWNKAFADAGIDPGSVKAQIELVMKETQKGRGPIEIAQRSGLDPALTEQIARLYVTHPGVTADGIMAKMGL